MELGLGEVLGKPIMKSIISKSESVMAIYKWSRYSIRRYIQREILPRVLIYFISTQVIEKLWKEVTYQELVFRYHDSFYPLWRFER